MPFFNARDNAPRYGVVNTATAARDNPRRPGILNTATTSNNNARDNDPRYDVRNIAAAARDNGRRPGVLNTPATSQNPRDRSPRVGVLNTAMSRLSTSDESSSRGTSGASASSESTAPVSQGSGAPSARQRAAKQSFSTNAAWTFYVGKEKKMFHFFRDHIAEKSSYLKSQMEKQAASGGPNEIVLEKIEPTEFEVFAHWTYQDCLPDSVVRASKLSYDEAWPAVPSLIKLFKCGWILHARSFRNRAIDVIVDIQRKAGHEFAMWLPLVSDGHLNDLQGSTLYDFAINCFVLHCVNRRDTERIFWFETEVPFTTSRARLYYDMATMLAAHLVKPVNSQYLLMAGEWHVHSRDEVCYLEYCPHLSRLQASDDSDNPLPRVEGGAGAPT